MDHTKNDDYKSETACLRNDSYYKEYTIRQHQKN
jgi:hypothetical protein